MNQAVSINNNSIKKKYFMVFICMFMQAIPFGVAQNIQPLFIPYVINNFGFSLAGFSLIFTFGAMASAAFSPFLGKLFGKVNIKVLFIVGTMLSSLGFLGFGFANTLPQFYILSAISQIGCVLFSGLGVPYVINNWFPKKGRGKALGIAFSGGSIGNTFWCGTKYTTFIYTLCNKQLWVFISRVFFNIHIWSNGISSIFAIFGKIIW